MICELCGHNSAVGFRVRIEGGLVSACEACSSSCEIVSKITPQVKAPKKKIEAPKTTDVIISDEPEAKAAVEYELVEDYGAKVKVAREKHGWTQDDLGKLINETHSMVHRIELGKLEPSVDIAHKLESKLGIRLLAAHEEESDLPKNAKAEKELTLGDMVLVRKRNQ